MSTLKIHNTIIDYLSGELTHDDTLMFEKWLNESPDNQAVFNTIKTQWDNEALPNKRKQDKAWERLSNSIQERKKSFIRRNAFPIAAAASILLLIASGWFLKNTAQNMVSITTNENTFRRDTLANGSIVFLYPSSSIEVVKISPFSNKEKITLKGEAFFIVPSNTGKNFNINVGNALINVKGTTFRVNGSCNKDVSVMVESGEVILTSINKNKNELIVQAGEKGFFTNANNDLRKQPKTENIYLIYQPVQTN